MFAPRLLLFACAVLPRLHAARGDTWCNQYLCLAATRTADHVTYTVAARTTAVEGWLAVGTGHRMGGSKMWLVYPSAGAGTGGNCVLSERDGIGHTAPVPTEQPVAVLLPREHVALEEAWGCAFTVPTAKLEYFNSDDDAVTSAAAKPGMDMLWAYSSRPPTFASVVNESKAGIRMHEAFGTFVIRFDDDAQEATGGHEAGADKPGNAPAKALPNGEADEAKAERRKRMIQAHAVLMVRPPARLFLVPAGRR
ncbi:hypothetical protein QFC19_008221 [Naganishia cerealis]|uniref:Uncharacterized protein n=1 Tax=Naganishia cerealis TaxID=610337 RepID=A0ACC2V3T9_9TREE|nr:hypothetical protein QFC19_008221 [Naganishia cerealis]